MADDPREIKMENVKSIVERASKDAAPSDNDDEEERR